MLGNHLLGLYEKALNPQDSWPVRLGKAKALGFDFMELSIDEADSRLDRLYWPKEKLRALKRECELAELPLMSMCLSAHRRFPFGSRDLGIRSKAREIMERAIGVAAELGIRVIQLAGYDVYYEPSTEESREAFLDGLSRAAGLAAQRQIMLGVEIMDTAFYNSITKHLWFEERVASPWLRVYPDIGNLTAWGNDVPNELERGISSIVGVHLKDTLAVTPVYAGRFKGVPFGSGCVDFQAFFRRMEMLGYRGPYLIEMWFDPAHDDACRAAEAKAFIEGRYKIAMADLEQPRTTRT